MIKRLPIIIFIFIIFYLYFKDDVFKDKTILLPCDDPEWSNFTKFFAQNFERFGLKKTDKYKLCSRKQKV